MSPQASGLAFLAVLIGALVWLAWIVLREKAAIAAALRNMWTPPPPPSMLPQDELLIREALDRLRRDGLL